MSEDAVILATRYPNTAETLLSEFRALGVRDGETLIVHSSLSSLGWVCGGPVAVIDALLAAVGERGTLVMPAHTGDNSDPGEWCNPPVPKEWCETIRNAMPPFDPVKSPTRGMGAIAECFRSYPGVLRSGHPQTSFCARGKNAAFITENHPLTPQLGPDSPIGKLYRLGARILLVGVGYDRCTCLHLAEALLPVEKVRNGAAIIEEGRRVWKWFEDFDVDSDAFPPLGEDFERSGGPVVRGRVGNAECRLLPVRETVDFGLGWLREKRGQATQRKVTDTTL